MLSCDSYARILGLNPQPDATRPWVVFVGMRVHEKLSTELYSHYKVKTLLCDPPDLHTINTSFSSHFVFGKGAFQHPDTFHELWRVAKEGAHVIILRGLHVGGAVEKAPDITNPQEYGLLTLVDGALPDWPYQEGIIRKDLAKHFHR
jgi:hypothetical protein